MAQIDSALFGKRALKQKDGLITSLESFERIKMSLKITAKEAQKVTIGGITMTVQKIRENRVEFLFEGDPQVKIVGPNMQKKLDNKRREAV